MSWQRLFANPRENPTRRVGGLLIRSDDKWKDFKYRNEVPESVLASQFDYQDPEDTIDGFFKYQNTWYHLDQFMRAPDDFGGWDGYASDSYSSGTVIKVSSDGEKYKVGSYRTAPT